MPFALQTGGSALPLEGLRAQLRVHLMAMVIVSMVAGLAVGVARYAGLVRVGLCGRSRGTDDARMTTRRVLASLVAVLIITISILASVQPETLRLVRALPYGDKLGHLGLFAFLTFSLAVAFARHLCGIMICATCVVVFALLDEGLQWMLPRRTFSIDDLLCSLTGIIAGSVAARLAQRRERDIRELDRPRPTPEI